MKRIAFFVFCFLLPLCSLKGQSFKAFSGDGVVFPEEAKQFFLTDRNAEKKQQADAEKLVDEFAVVFSMLIDSEQKAFLNMCNVALKANMRPFPTFENVLRSAVNFFNDGQFAKSYNNFIRSLYTLAENKKIRDFNVLVESTNRLMETGFLYESMSAKWLADGECLFEYVDEKPRFVFLKTNLTCYANRDSAKIHITQGAYYPLTSSWQGKTGLVDFTRAGYELSEMFIQLSEYQINLKTSRYQADSVNFFNKIYFSKPLFGRMEEKVLAGVKPGQATYPMFTSYDNRLKIENLFENVDFEGQYMQVGSRVRCGEKDDFATLKFRHKDKVVLTVSAQNFLFGKQRISSPLAEVHIPLDDAEIVHPTCEVRYDDVHRELSILHPTANAFKNPIYNDYHKLDMYVEAIYWTIDSTFMDLRMLRIPENKGTGIFESKQFFSEQDMRALMEQIDYNPLLMLRKLSENYNSRNLGIPAIADYFRQDETQTKVLLLRLASLGFLHYNGEKGEVELLEKLFHYLRASAKNTDYDVLKIVSEQINMSNAVLDLETKELRFFGVAQIGLSTAQNVYVIPDHQMIVMRKNRDFSFDGKIHCGKFDFVAEKCMFYYDQFKIAMDTVRTMQFSVKYGNPDIYGQYQLKAIGTTIEQLSGEILIDNANNKSGRKWHKEYPIFESYRNSYVSYENPNIQHGVYFFDDFYYTIYPFRLENLNNFETDKLRFVGHLTSAGIFPDIHEDLKVMPDFSLGFMKSSPDTGWGVYENRARFYDTLNLSNDGLIGTGKLEFITSTNLSKRFVFMPDSMNAIVRKFNVAAQSIGAEFPVADAQQSQLHWEPYENYFRTRNQKDGFLIFDGEIKFFGELVLSGDGMIGSGRAVFANNTEMYSENFVFKDRELMSDNVKFAIKCDDGSTAIQSEEYSVEVDFDKQKAFFKNNDPEAYIDFPANRYLCFMNELEWDIASNRVVLKNSEQSSYTSEQLDKMTLRELIAIGDDLPGSDFISMHPKQDSLTFYSPLAEYNLETKELNIQQVRIIYTADVAVQPREGNIIITKDASIRTFDSANVLVDVENQYYDIYDASVSIQGRSNYTANGMYNYVDETRDVFPIYFEKLTPNKDGITTGKARIEVDEDFSLSPAFAYTGQVTMKADEPLLTFNGSSQIQFLCEEEDTRSWFNFYATIDPNDVTIPIPKQLKDKSGKFLGTGFYTNNQGDLFSSFFTPIKSTDKIVLRRDGVLYYDSVSKSYVVEPDSTYPDSEKLFYNTNNCSLKTYGTPAFQLNLGRVAWDNFGTLYHDYKDQSILFDGVIGMNFFFDEKALKMFAESLEDADGSGVEQNTDKFIDYIYSKVSQRDAERLEKEIEMYGAYRRLPSEIEKTILFSDVKMQWDENSRSFVSLGKLGVAAIGSTQINKYLNGTLQIVKSRRGDVINLYIELGRRDWYFFSYSDGLMQVISSNSDFNDAITMLKASKRKSREGKGRGSYEFNISTVRRKTDFQFRTNAIKNNFSGEDDDLEEEEYDDEEEILDEEELLDEELLDEEEEEFEDE